MVTKTETGEVDAYDPKEAISHWMVCGLNL